MLNMGDVFSNLAGLFLLIAVGYAAVKFQVLPASSTKLLSNLLMQVTLPATILTSLVRPYDVAFIRDGVLIAVLGAALFALYGLLALPGMELTTLEEAHIICLFPDLACASAFDAIVHHRLPPMVNDPAVFGPQVLMDADDRVLGEETALLAGATGIGVYEVAGLVRSFGGTAFPAHIDRPSFSVLSNLGLWDPAMGFPLAEVSKNCPPDLFDRPDLSGVRHITACDAHYLDQIPDAHQYMALPERTPQAVLAWLAG